MDGGKSAIEMYMRGGDLPGHNGRAENVSTA